MCSFPALSPAASWATQAQSLISMWSLTWTRHHAVNMKGYANTQALSRARSLSHTHTHSSTMHLFFYVCLSCTYCSILSKKGLETQKLTIRTPQLPPTPHSFSALRTQFISIMEKRKSASTRIVCGTSTNLPPPSFFFFLLKVPTRLPVWQNSCRYHFWRGRGRRKVMFE